MLRRIKGDKLSEAIVSLVMEDGLENMLGLFNLLPPQVFIESCQLRCSSEA